MMINPRNAFQASWDTDRRKGKKKDAMKLCDQSVSPRTVDTW